ncbi:hypothetical protein CDAR_530501 [Caerostris darwini]|uniref:DUF5641 domain-containing protein n=1 Tax=Caerostris darwini TaxID=1538125 RepID=A0AAV4PM31_9ARAC|nr:hypothetical protein CDAR_530501 [Caerostris darwini]
MGQTFFIIQPFEDPASERIPEKLLEQRSDPIFSNSCTINPTLQDIFEKHSSLTKIIRILAYCRRFVIRCKLGNNLASEATYLSLSEIIEIKSILFLWVQERHFPDELNTLQAGKTLSPSSKILSLNPFLDHGENLNFLPYEPANEELPHGTRWQLVQSIRKGFWKRWYNEYLYSLQQSEGSLKRISKLDTWSS